MTEGLWLDDDELFALTGKKQYPKQVEVLAALRPKVHYRVRPDDGRPLVDRAQFVEPYVTRGGRKIERPDFEAVES